METLKVIGFIQSPLKEIGDCPLQEHEGAPEVTLKIDEEFWPALSGLKAGAAITLLTWLHKGNRATLTTQPRNNPEAPFIGVFATRSPDRPNPIGLHEAKIVAVNNDGTIRISHLEVIDGTPLLDIKPVLSGR